jgi:transcription elongation factor/antiterminator RfaH
MINWERVDKDPRWYVIHTQPKQESRAESNLRAWQVETFNPIFKERYYNPYTGQPTYRIKSLFPQYIFGRFQAGSLINKVCYTRGVRSVVSFGERPTAVDDEVIALLQSRVDENGLIHMGECLKAGDKVVIKNGAWKGLLGVFEHEAKHSERVMILLSCVNYQGRIIVDRELVKKV